MIETLEMRRERDRLEGEVAQVCGIVNVANARLVSLVAEVVESGAWEGVGLRSPSHWVTWKCGVSPSRARRIVTISKRLREFPVVRAAFGAGELTEEQVAVICRYTPPVHDAEVAELARQTTVPQLTSVLRRYNFDADDDPHDPKPEPEEKRQTTFGPTEGGTWRLYAELPPDEGSLAERALERAKRDLKAAGHSNVSWSDALVAIFDAYLAAKASGRSPGDRNTVMLHMATDEDGRTGAHLHLGPVLPDALRRYLDCDARIRPIFEVGGKPVSFGRAERIVADEIRTLVEDRDGCCREPGCGQTVGLQVHHLWHWEDGGPTETWNLVAFCPASHRRHHLGYFDVSGNADDPNGLVFTDSRGRVLDAAGRPKPPATLEPVGNWQHPSGERLDPHAVQFSVQRRAS